VTSPAAGRRLATAAGFRRVKKGGGKWEDGSFPPVFLHEWNNCSLDFREKLRASPTSFASTHQV